MIQLEISCIFIRFHRHQITLSCYQLHWLSIYNLLQISRNNIMIKSRQTRGREMYGITISEKTNKKTNHTFYCKFEWGSVLMTLYLPNQVKKAKGSTESHLLLNNCRTNHQKKKKSLINKGNIPRLIWSVLLVSSSNTVNPGSKLVFFHIMFPCYCPALQKKKINL